VASATTLRSPPIETRRLMTLALAAYSHAPLTASAA
jgi:hypothetical protein